MESRVKLSKDGTSIDFTQSESLPTSLKKFRQSPEIEGFYRFIYENDLQKEALEILEKIIQQRKAKRETKSAKPQAKAKAAPAAPAIAKPAAAPKEPVTAKASSGAKANGSKSPQKKANAPAVKAKAAAPKVQAKAKPKAKKPTKPAKKSKR